MIGRENLNLVDNTVNCLYWVSDKYPDLLIIQIKGPILVEIEVPIAELRDALKRIEEKN